MRPLIIILGTTISVLSAVPGLPQDGNSNNSSILSAKSVCGDIPAAPWNVPSGDGHYFHILGNPRNEANPAYRICNASTEQPISVRLDNDSDNNLIVDVESCVDVRHAVAISVHSYPDSSNKPATGFYCVIPDV